MYGKFFRCSRAANSTVLGRIWPNFQLVRDIMVLLVTCKYEEDPIKNEGARVLTGLYDVFSDAQGQLTPKSAVEFCRNSNMSCHAFSSPLTQILPNNEFHILNHLQDMRPNHWTKKGFCLFAALHPGQQFFSHFWDGFLDLTSTKQWG